MRVLGLDLSTKTGWAVLEDKALVSYGLINVELKSIPFAYPMNLFTAAKMIGNDVIGLVGKWWKPGTMIVIEDTNIGPSSQRYAQKCLEFIHCMVLHRLADFQLKPIYVNSFEWRKLTGVVMSTDHKVNNKAILENKEKEKKDVIEKVRLLVDRKYTPLILGSKTKTERNKFEVSMRKERRALEKHFLKDVRARSGKVTFKTLSVNRVNELYGKTFSFKDNDICDAILIARSYFEGTMSGRSTVK